MDMNSVGLYTCISIITCVISVQTFTEEPGSVIVLEGSDVLLNCRVFNKTGVVQWTKDDFGLGSERSLPQYPHLSLIGHDSETWNLKIQNLTINDDGKYQCQ